MINRDNHNRNGDSRDNSMSIHDQSANHSRKKGISLCSRSSADKYNNNQPKDETNNKTSKPLKPKSVSISASASKPLSSISKGLGTTTGTGLGSF
jgi:hypothetical protein